jgi:hypothetical protein
MGRHKFSRGTEELQGYSPSGNFFYFKCGSSRIDWAHHEKRAANMFFQTKKIAREQDQGLTAEQVVEKRGQVVFWIETRESKLDRYALATSNFEKRKKND